MLGQFVCKEGKSYNIIVLAGGIGTRMGSASEYIPKALTEIGKSRAIDLILDKFALIAHKIIIGTGSHADLLESYVKGRYSEKRLCFSRESREELKNNGTSLLYALDYADSRHGTIITFCDLLLLSNPVVFGSSLYLANTDTKGIVGTFRHGVKVNKDYVEAVVVHEEPKSIDTVENGVVGLFVLEDTLLLKEIAYAKARKGELKDITSDVISTYVSELDTKAVIVESIIEFGNEKDLIKARQFWEVV